MDIENGLKGLSSPSNRRASIILFALFDADQIAQSGKHLIDLSSRFRVHHSSDRLADIEISDGVEDDTLDSGQLASTGRDGELKIGKCDGSE